jgi:hypothetical protein
MIVLLTFLYLLQSIATSVLDEVSIFVACRSVARQLLRKQIPAEMNTHATIEELPFLCNSEVNTRLQKYRGIVENDVFHSARTKLF